MIRHLLRIAINLVDSAVALVIANWLIAGVTLHAGGFVVAVVIFTGVQALVTPFVANQARKHAPAILGGIGLVAALLALWVATLFQGGLEIHGVEAWIATPVIVWLVTALGGWLLGFVVLNRWYDRKQKEKALDAAVAKRTEKQR